LAYTEKQIKAAPHEDEAGDWHCLAGRIELDMAVLEQRLEHRAK